MNLIHRWLGTYEAKVHAFIALTPFSKDILTRAGLPRERIHLKPNFSPETVKLTSPRLHRFVYVGRIARFKGAHLLLDAWARLSSTGHQLLMVGDGPDRAELEKRFARHENILWCGNQSREKVLDLIAASRWLVQPSLAYENFPMSVLEALSAGTPVIVPNHGAFSAIVSEGMEGLLFSAGDTGSLSTVLQTAFETSEGTWTQLSSNARNKHRSEYAGPGNYAQLMSIYEQAAKTFREVKGRVRNPKIAETVGAVLEQHAREQ
jgi:glycosyltransferase involved in cell wall biosynthesis